MNELLCAVSMNDGESTSVSSKKGFLKRRFACLAFPSKHGSDTLSGSCGDFRSTPEPILSGLMLQLSL